VNKALAPDQAIPTVSLYVEKFFAWYDTSGGNLGLYSRSLTVQDTTCSPKECCCPASSPSRIAPRHLADAASLRSWRGAPASGECLLSR
jgi:hypothetical protein